MDYPVYCEQMIFGDYFEPVNTITNLAFIIASLLAFFNLKRKGNLEFRSVLLLFILFLIGIGSLLWHLYRSDVTVMMDSIPIMVFILSYLFIYSFHITNKLLHRLLIICGFFVFLPLMSILLTKFFVYFQENRISMYLLPISYFLILQIYNRYYKVPVIKRSLIAIFIFLISLFFRQIDLFVCEKISIGTHFIWHILNSIVLYKMIMLLYPKLNVEIDKVKDNSSNAI